MFFKKQLLHILQKYNGERTVFSAFHLLKGKKSGQTIQDVGLFDVQPYFHLLPKLTKEIYSEQISALEKNGEIHIDEEQRIYVVQKNRQQPDYFNGWHYRGREHIFFARLQLVVQTISNEIQGDKRFLPIVRDESVQHFARHYLLHINYQQESTQRAFIEQFYQAIEKLNTEGIVKTIIVYRLTGYQAIGLTWAQFAEQLQLDEIDVQLYFVHGLHRLIELIEKGEFPILETLLHRIRVETVLTESTQKTAALLKQGFTLEQIAQRRRLKMSTIEDHIAELAMTDPNFEVSNFVPDALNLEIQGIIETMDIKKLKLIKERIPQASYFQIRLVLAIVGGKQNA